MVSTKKEGDQLDVEGGTTATSTDKAGISPEACINHTSKSELLESHRNEQGISTYGSIQHSAGSQFAVAIDGDNLLRNKIEKQVSQLTSDPAFAGSDLENRLEQISALLEDNREYLNSAPLLKEQILRDLAGSEEEIIRGLDNSAEKFLKERASLLSMPEHERPWDYETRLAEAGSAVDNLVSSLSQVVDADQATEVSLRERLQKREDELRTQEVFRQACELQRQAAIFTNTGREQLHTGRKESYLEAQSDFLDRNPVIRESLNDQLRRANQSGEGRRDIFERRFQELATELSRGWFRRDPDRVASLLSSSDRVELEYFRDRLKMQNRENFGQLIHDNFGKYDAVQTAYRNALGREDRSQFHVDTSIIDAALSAPHQERFALFTSRNLVVEMNAVLEDADPALALIELGSSLSPTERLKAFEQFEAAQGVSVVGILSEIVPAEDRPLIIEFLENGEVSQETAELHYGMKLGSIECMRLSLGYLDPANPERQEQFDQITQELLSRYVSAFNLSEGQLTAALENTKPMVDEVREVFALAGELSEEQKATVEEHRDTIEFMILQEEAKLYAGRGDFSVAKTHIEEYLSKENRYKEEAQTLQQMVEVAEFKSFQGTSEDPRYQLVQDLREQVRELAEKQRRYAGGARKNADRYQQDAVEASQNWGLFSSGFWSYHTGATDAIVDTANAETKSAAARFGNYRDIENALSESMEHSQRFLSLESQASALRDAGRLAESQELLIEAQEAFQSSISVLDGLRMVHESEESFYAMQQARQALDTAIDNIDSWDRTLRTTRKGVVFAGAAIATGGLALGAGGGAGLISSMGLVKGGSLALGGGIAAGTGVWTVGTAAEHGRSAVQGDISFGDAAINVVHDLPEGAWEATKGSITGLAAVGGGSWMAGRFAGTKLAGTKLGQGLLTGFGSGVAGGTAITGLSVGEREYQFQKNIAQWQEEEEQAMGREFTAEEKSEYYAGARRAMNLNAGAIAGEWGMNAGMFFVFSSIGATASQMRAATSSGARGTFQRGAITTGEATTSGGLGFGAGVLQNDGSSWAQSGVEEAGNVITYDIVGNLLGRRMPGSALRSVTLPVRTGSAQNSNSPVRQLQSESARLDIFDMPLRLEVPEGNRQAALIEAQVNEALRTTEPQRQGPVESRESSSNDRVAASKESPVLKERATQQASQKNVTRKAFEQGVENRAAASSEAPRKTEQAEAESYSFKAAQEATVRAEPSAAVQAHIDAGRRVVRSAHGKWHSFKQRAAVAVLTASSMFSTIAPNTARADGPVNFGNKIVHVENGLNRTSVPDAPSRQAPAQEAPQRAPAPEAPKTPAQTPGQYRAAGQSEAPRQSETVRQVESNAQGRAGTQNVEQQTSARAGSQTEQAPSRAETKSEVETARTDQNNRTQESKEQVLEVNRALAAVNFRNHEQQRQHQQQKNEEVRRFLDEARRQNETRPARYRRPRFGSGNENSKQEKKQDPHILRDGEYEDIPRENLISEQDLRRAQRFMRPKTDDDGNVIGAELYIKGEGGG